MQVLVFFYNIFIRLYYAAIRLAALWNPKAKEWLGGRKHLFEQLSRQITEADKVIWIHCASAGELEQGKPLVEALKENFTSHKLLISFFSPSGFAAGKKYAQADVVTYLPLDTSSNARKFMEIVHPELIVFVKYEYWYHHLAAAAYRHIPVLLVSALFREQSVFFRSYGKLHRQMLFLFRHIFVQDQASKDLLLRASVQHCSVAGDTRFDRVVAIAKRFVPLEILEKFTHGHQVIVAGSTWLEDEQLLAGYTKKNNVRLVIAPHEIHASHLSSILTMFPKAILYSQINTSLVSGKSMENQVWKNIAGQQSLHLEKMLEESTVLVIDGYGLLSKLYHYATIAYIGGGFNKSGIHNTLEAAVYNKPVLFGPNYRKFREARELVALGAAFSVKTPESLHLTLDHLLHHKDVLIKAGKEAGQYVQENTGTTSIVLKYIQEKRLLTRW